MTSHLSDGQIEALALKAVTRIASIAPQRQAQAWDMWAEEVAREHGPLVAQELIAVSMATV